MFRFFVFVFCGWEAYGISVPGPGIELLSTEMEDKVLTTRPPPGKSPLNGPCLAGRVVPGDGKGWRWHCSREKQGNTHSVSGSSLRKPISAVDHPFLDCLYTDSDFFVCFYLSYYPGPRPSKLLSQCLPRFLDYKGHVRYQGSSLEGPCKMELKNFLFTGLLGTCLKEAFPSLTPYLIYWNLPGLDPKPEKGHEWNNWQHLNKSCGLV